MANKTGAQAPVLLAGGRARERLSWAGMTLHDTWQPAPRPPLRSLQRGRGKRGSDGYLLKAYGAWISGKKKGPDIIRTLVIDGVWLSKRFVDSQD